MSGGGVDIVRPDGTLIDFLETGGVPAELRVPRRATCSSPISVTSPGSRDAAFMGGRLWRVDVGVEGMPLFRGAIA